jgi:stalled ribosome rescue protein Dom34
VRIKILINDHITEKVNSFNYLRCTITVTNNTDIEIKKNRFNKYSREHGNESSGSIKCWDILE